MPRNNSYAIILGDVDGSVDAIMEVLDTYDSEQCRLQILSYGVGAVSDHDVEMATTFNGEFSSGKFPSLMHIYYPECSSTWAYLATIKT